MKTVSKEILTKKVSQELSYHPDLVKEVLDECINQICVEYKKGNRIEIREFGIFTPYVRAPRKYKCFKTGEFKKMPKKKMLKFKCSKHLHI